MIKIPIIEMSEKKRLVIVLLLILLFVGLMVFEYVRTENYKKEIVDKCLKNEKRICICQEDFDFQNGLYQVVK